MSLGINAGGEMCHNRVFLDPHWLFVFLFPPCLYIDNPFIVNAVYTPSYTYPAVLEQ